ncbi:MAG: efflux RND transporter periplasmic adaptor subunit [Rhodobacteraceae bacterium]|nr:efflux RND transporter periplasmic adaptor subunit [Paracoccaceae bacterium]
MPRFAPALAILALAFLTPALAAETSAPPDTVAASLPAIRVTPAANATLRDTVIATGLFQPAETVFIQPQIEGQAIEELKADVGDRVEAGQVLARLSDRTLSHQRSQLSASRAAAVASVAQSKAQIAEAQALRDDAERTLDRTRTLQKQGTASQAALDQAVAQSATASARLNAAVQGLAAAEAQIGLIDAQIADVDLNLSRTNVTAPVAGVIADRNARIGAIASAGGTPMFTLIRDGALELYADVPEQDLLRIEAGQPATMRVVGRGLPVTGHVRLVEPTVDLDTRLGRVRIALDDPGLVRDGMFGEAEILVAQREALAVPVTAVAADSTVLLVQDGQVRRVPVETGIRDGSRIEIRSGLVQGDTLVSRAGVFVRDGDRINPVPDEAPAVSN